MGLAKEDPIRTTVVRRIDVNFILSFAESVRSKFVSEKLFEAVRRFSRMIMLLYIFARGRSST